MSGSTTIATALSSSLFGLVVAMVARQIAEFPSVITKVTSTTPSISSTVTSSATETTTAYNYTQWTIAAIGALQTWYDEETGLWNSTGWWNSANCLTVLGDFYALDAKDAEDLGLSKIFSNTFTQAQKVSKTVQKVITTRSDGAYKVEPLYTDITAAAIAHGDLETRGFSGFINDYYDDEGWWALGWIRAYDVTGIVEYLSMAESIFSDMQRGTTAVCGGGIWWSKKKAYKNAITNEQYLAVAASLANRVSDSNSSPKYLDIAKNQWLWFKNSGMINSENLTNDGLVINPNGTCRNNGVTVWTYNQGVILGGLVELYHATGNQELLSEASTIAHAAISSLSANGILHESCEDDECGTDRSQFKGIFMRNLQYLQFEVHDDDFRNFILDNAQSIWSKARDSSGYLGLNWEGPSRSVAGGPNASTHSSAMDALVAAMAVV